MALEVARAYDENKNLVPLYILTDDDPVYEPVTPGFIWSFDNYGSSSNPNLVLNISNNAMNPTGGALTVSSDYEEMTNGIDAEFDNASIRINNNSSFDIIISSFVIKIFLITNTYREMGTFQLSSQSISKDSYYSGTIIFSGATGGGYSSRFYQVNECVVSRVL